MKLTLADKKVIRSFVEGKASESQKLTTDGSRLDGCWMGGKGIAIKKTGGVVEFGDLGSKAAQIVQHAVEREMRA